VSTAFLAPSAVILAATALVIALAVIIPGAAASYLLGRPTGTLPAVGTMFEAGPASANAPAACGTKHSPVSTAKRCLPSCRYSVTSRISPTLRALGRRSAVPVELDLRAGRRLPGLVEVAAYCAVSEPLANAAKHARASVVHVELDTPGTILQSPGP
jgi:hypothetical protein